MSAWEESEIERQLEARQHQRNQEIAKVQRENPWLSHEDCVTWVRQQEEARKPPPKCCPCQGRTAGIVRTGFALGPCKCGCHQPRPRSHPTCDQMDRDLEQIERDLETARD